MYTILSSEDWTASQSAFRYIVNTGTSLPSGSGLYVEEMMLFDITFN